MFNSTAEWLKENRPKLLALTKKLVRRVALALLVLVGLAGLGFFSVHVIPDAKSFIKFAQQRAPDVVKFADDQVSWLLLAIFIVIGGAAIWIIWRVPELHVAQFGEIDDADRFLSLHS